MKNEKRVCRDCGQVIEGDFVEIDGEYVCQECFDEQYFYCEDCGKLELQDDGYWIEDREKMVCGDCCSRNYYHCEDCGDYVYNATYINGYGYVCEHCFDNGNYYYCDDCGDYFYEDDIHYDECDDRYYCDSCYEEHGGGLLYDYHEFSDWHLYKGQNEDTPPYYIGKEIELEPKNYSNVEEVVRIMNKYINAVGMHDGSLNDGGVEVVTHPESWQYLQEHKEDYRNFFNDIERLNYGDDGDTGLHFHITRPNDDVVARVIVLLESFKDEIKKLSRRNGDFHWSKFITDTQQDEKEKVKYQATKYLKEKYVKEYHDRYLALNLQNSRTIEFRFFNGANNFEEFWGALQFIHNLMDLALDETRDINTIDWQELMVGDELREQARKQEVLDVSKKAKDMSEVVEKIEKLKEDTKEEIKKTFKNFIKYMTKELENKRLELLDKNSISNIITSGLDFINNFRNDLNYLETISNFYKGLDNYTIPAIKNDMKYYNKTDNKKYQRYFKQVEKTIEKYEKEEI